MEDATALETDMGEIVETHEELIDLSKVRKFIDYEKSRFDLDRKAIKEARQMANGDSWRKSFNDVKTTLRHKVRIDAVNQIINKICSKFTSNPFRFISGNEQLNLDYNSYDTAIALAFRDCVVCGQGFIYCDYARHRLERLDVGSVMIDSSNNSPYVIWVEKEPNDYGSYRIDSDNLGFDSTIIPHNEETEHLVFKIYSKMESGIAVAKVVNGEIIQSEILPISKYPIIRITADESWSEKDEKKSFRGLYHKAQGLSDIIDVTFSRIAGNILTAPRMKYWVAASLAGSEAFQKAMKGMNESDTAYAFYDSYDDQGRSIPPPARDEGRLFVDELIGVTDKIVQYINMLFGFENAENADTGNKTAQEILFRKENQNANYSQYLFNLSAAMGNVCHIYESLGLEKVYIVSGPYENIYRQTTQQSILAINDYCTAQPQKAMIAPLLIKFSNLDEQTKTELNQAIQQQTNVQQIISQSQQTAQQMQQLQAQNQQMGQAMQAMQQQMINSDKAIQADLTKEQMKLADKSKERAFKSEENSKDRAVDLFKIELGNGAEPLPLPVAATAVEAANTGTQAIQNIPLA